MNGLDTLSEEQKQEFAKQVAIEMPAGCGTFHHPLMVHGSYENHSPIARRALVINVFADGTQSNSDEELLAGFLPYLRAIGWKDNFSHCYLIQGKFYNK